MAKDDSQSKLKVFISYAHEDAAFAEELATGLDLAGFDPMRDATNIGAGDEWEHRIEELIGSAATTVFVISPASIVSVNCSKELEKTQSLRKRILPIMLLPTPDESIPAALKRLHYIFFDRPNSFARGLAALSEALKTDAKWVRQHTQLGDMATRWDLAARRDSYLIQGEALAVAREWLANPPKFAPEPGELTTEFIAASEAAETARLSAELKRATQTARFRKLTAGGVVALAVGCFGAAVVFYLQRAAVAETLSLARDTSSKLVDLVTTDLRNVQGIRTETVAELLEKAQFSFDKLAKALRADPTFQAERARMLSGFGEAYFNANALEKARASHAEGLEIYRRLEKDSPEHVDWQRGIADQIDRLGEIKRRNEDIDNALADFENALGIRSSIASRLPNDPQSHADIAASYTSLGRIAMLKRDPLKALDLHQSAIAAVQSGLAVATIQRTVNDLKLKHAVLAHLKGEAYAQLKDPRSQHQQNLESLAIRQEILFSAPDNAEFKRSLGWGHCYIGNSHESSGNFREAADSYRECLRLHVGLVESDHGKAQARHDVAWAYHYSGNVQRRLRNLDLAGELYNEARRHREALVFLDRTDTRNRKDYAFIYKDIGELDLEQGRTEEARKHFGAARDELESLERELKDAFRPDWRYALSQVHNQIGHIQKSKADLPAALGSYRTTLQHRLVLSASKSAEMSWIAGLATSHFLVGETFILLSNMGEAQKHLEESLRIRREISVKPTVPADNDRQLKRVEQALSELAARRHDAVKGERMP